MELNITNIKELSVLTSELDYERAISIYDKLRWMVKDDKSLESEKDHLKNLIKKYELENWSNPDNITDSQIEESDTAELIVLTENNFNQFRKELIRGKLKSLGLKQQDLGKILNHRKNYMSELINGIRPFSRNDLVIIHRVLKIELKHLVPPFIENNIIEHINQILSELNIPEMSNVTNNTEIKAFSSNAY